MVDITAKLFWYRVKEWYENMADKLNDFVPNTDSKETANVIKLILGWFLLAFAVYIIGNLIVNQIRKLKGSFPTPEPETERADENTESTEHVLCTPEIKTSAAEVFEELEKTEENFLIPICTGDDLEIVDWINNVFTWIYSQRVISPIVESWLSALNARTRLSSTDHGILVDFKEVVYTSAPYVTDVSEAFNYKGDMNIVGDIDAEDLVYEVVVTQFKEKEKIAIPFILNVKRLSGKLFIETIPEELMFLVRFLETPDVKLSAEPVKDNIESEDDLGPLSDLVCEIATEALTSPIVHLKFSCFPDCPRLTLKSPLAEEETFESTEGDNDEQLLVKIIKANDLGGTEGCLKPYCVVEMDEPPQKFETKEIDEKFHPLWDESFVFKIKDISAELLFELYDRGKSPPENFLGLGIVSVDELIKNPSQRQIIPLQSRPLEDDNVTGTLTAEFLFMYQSTPVAETLQEDSGKIVETNSRVTAGGTVITTTTIKRTTEGMFDIL